MTGERVVVKDLGVTGRAWVLRPDGTATLAEGATTAYGFGVPWPVPFSAAYVAGGTLWLRVGPRRWDLSTVERVRLLRDASRRSVYALDLVGGGSEQVVVTFPRNVVLERMFDPTHDELASADEDVMKLLPYEAPDGWRSRRESFAHWAVHIAAHWGAGIEV